MYLNCCQVYYGDSYAKEFGIDIQAFGKGCQITSSKESDLPRVDSLIIPTSIDHVFDASQEDRSRSVEGILLFLYFILLDNI